ncbi:hypothetical protein BJX68DRAFT_279366 [Aspergillus pseudodeflectus]|uniref:AAA+ ATPase domain-containing protein n=1 Tax=Aspergillus pseudodeflectus TaxID=176178 RepID=A0ABR4JHN1_9EURO
MTQIPLQKHEDSSNDLEQGKVESEVPWSQSTMDDAFYAAPQVLFNQSAGDDQSEDDAEWDSALNEVFIEPPVWQRQEDASAEGRYTLQFLTKGAQTHDFLENNDISWLVFKTYTTDLLGRPLTEMHPDFEKLFPNFDARQEISAPYLFWFTFRSGFSSALGSLSPRHRALIQNLGKYISDQYGEIYARVDDQLLRGVVSAETMKYLVKPGDVLVSEEDGAIQAYLAASWAKEVTLDSSHAHHKSGPRRWEISAWSYGVDGTFYIKDSTLEMELDVRGPEDKVDLRQLNMMPIQYTALETSMALQERGKNYWRCREKRLVSYYERNLSENNPKRKKMSPLLMSYLFLFPPTIPGYSLSSKKRANLEIDRIQAVQWNKRAFENLEIGFQDKRLLEAAVTTRLNPRSGIDIIEGKDDSLKILLHGSSRTGKTYTAESLAELVEKPLYRITCADLGTEPKETERCMKTALYLGKRWDCIILLDDIGIFLEADTLRDVKHNALLAVLLRSLELYSGMVILTARYNGTVNEAFRSRVRFCFHYQYPTRDQRRRLWQNFIGRVKAVDQLNIDQRYPENHFDELAEIMMNGRQIRDTITTARQFAKHKGWKTEYGDLKHVIDLARDRGGGF